MRQGNCKAFEGRNVGGHGTARLLPADVGKADQEWIRSSRGLDGSLALIFCSSAKLNGE